MSNPIELEYFGWLVQQIAIQGRTRRTYNGLFNRMHETEFVWTVTGDDNRAQDALDLRHQFHPNFNPNRSASVLEVLVALSRKVSFLAGGEPDLWAWQLIENLDLERASDPLNFGKAEYINNVLGNLIWRSYNFDGSGGGFFPLTRPKEDQTKVEIWHQMNEYVNEIQEPI